MIKDPYRKIREALGLAKKYTDEQVAEAKKYTDERIEALAAQGKPEPIDVQAVASEVAALLPKPKKLKRKKKNAPPAMTPEEVMALIVGSLEEANKQYVETGDTIIIQEAPQKIVERIKEVTRVEGKDVDYDMIYAELDRRMLEWRQGLHYGGGSYDSLSMMRDVNLDGVPTDEQGNFLLGQLGGSAKTTFETIAKNLLAYDITATTETPTLITQTYDAPGGAIIKSISFDASGLPTQIVLSGNTPAGIDLTKTFDFTGRDIPLVTYS